MNGLEKGVFTISLDLELIWGTLDLFGVESFRSACQLEREEIIDRLLELFSEYEIPATWCILGHLFLDHCSLKNGGTKHPEIARPRHRWHTDDWFVHDPCTDEKTDPLFYGRSLVEKILACPVKQEIGSHSFSHVIFGDEGCSTETAETELKECIKAAGEYGVTLRSFAFPRDRVGHLPVLNKLGFTSFRGSIPRWYEQGENRNFVKRIAHFWDVVAATAPPVVSPTHEAGMWNIPGSMIYFPMHGVRRFVPTNRRVKRAIKGLETAVSEKQIFHLWFHPTNMAFETEKMFDGLRQIIEYAARLRDNGVLIIDSMSGIANRLDQQ